MEGGGGLERQEERARVPLVGHLRRSSISDKNKVNGEWGCWRGGCNNGQAGVTAMGEGDATPTGPYQSERGEAKSTTIDATGHTEYNEDAARYFSSLLLVFSFEIRSFIIFIEFPRYHAIIELYHFYVEKKTSDTVALISY